MKRLLRYFFLSRSKNHNLRKMLYYVPSNADVFYTDLVGAATYLVSLPVTRYDLNAAEKAIQQKTIYPFIIDNMFRLNFLLAQFHCHQAMCDIFL